MKRRFCALSALVVAFSLFVSGAAAQAVTADVCPEKLLRIGRLTNELLVEQAAIQRLETALQDQAQKQQAIATYREWAQVTFEASLLKPNYAPLRHISNVLTDIQKALEGKPEAELRRDLEKRRENEARLSREVALEESLAARCIQEAGAAAAAKPGLPVLTGAYSSPYGHTDLTQTGSQVNGAVKYDVSPKFPRGGRSTLMGTSFDGRIWKFNWHNTDGRYGSGQLTVLPDGTGLKGWWEDTTANPPKRENFWLYRK